MANANGAEWSDADAGYTRRFNAKGVFHGSGSEIAALDPVTPTSRYAFAGNGNDSVGSNNLTANGSPTYGTDGGVYGQYVILNGTSQYFTAANNTVFDVTTQDFSLWGFFYRTSDSGGVEYLLKKRDDSGGAGYHVRIESNDVLQAEIFDGTTERTADSSSAIALNTWYFWAASYDRDGNLVLYLYNYSTGALETSTTAISTASNTLTNTQTFTVGRNSAGSSSFFPGRIDHLNVLIGTAITSAQVQSIISNLHGGQLAVCHGTGSGFTTDTVYQRNEENTAWNELVEKDTTQTLTNKTISAGTYSSSMTITGAATLDNNIAINAKNSSGTSRNMIKRDSSNVLQLGDSTQNSTIAVNEAMTFSGNVDAALIDPRLFLRNRMYYWLTNTNDVGSAITGSATVTNGAPGIVVTGGGSAGDDAVAYTNTSSSQNGINLRRDRKFEFSFRIGDIDTVELECELGVHSNPSSNTARVASTQNYAMFTFDESADTSWHCVTAGAAAETDTDTNIAPADGDLLQIVSNETDIKFYINGTLVATHTTNLPGSTTAMGFRLYVNPEVGAASPNVGGVAFIGTDVT